MKALSQLQRDRLEVIVARSLAWYALPATSRDSYRSQAKTVVRDLEAIAIHGASDKRAAEAVLVQVIEGAQTA